MNKPDKRKIIKTVFRNKPIRVMVLLTMLFLAIIVSLTILSLSYKGRTSELQSEIQGIQNELRALQNIVTETEEDDSEVQEVKRGFAPYEEIIPFISLLENLFGLIDQEAIITIKDEENTILANRYADYEVRMDIGSKKNLLLKALDELHKSKYITKVMSFDMKYDTIEDQDSNKLSEVSLMIRLYFE